MSKRMEGIVKLDNGYSRPITPPTKLNYMTTQRKLEKEAFYSMVITLLVGDNKKDTLKC